MSTPVKITTLAEYQAAAVRTAPEPGQQHWFYPRVVPAMQVSEIIPLAVEHDRNVGLIHAALGVAGEAGELVDTVKKSMFYGKPLDIENLKEEAGDALWYLALLCRTLGCTLEEVAQMNIDKLNKRYPEKYTDAAAVARADKTQ